MKFVSRISYLLDECWYYLSIKNLLQWSINLGASHVCSETADLMFGPIKIVLTTIHTQTVLT